MQHNIVAVIQARMNSSRLSGKSLMTLHQIPLIEWVFKRVSKSKMINKIVVAIPNTLKDNALNDYLKNYLKANVVRGSETNVLNRIFEAAQQFHATHIVRVCADNPFVSPEEIDELIKFHFTEPFCDYTYNHIPLNNLYPDGLGAEIVSYKAFCKIKQNAIQPNHLEHCFNYLWDHLDQFTIKTFDPRDVEVCQPHLKFDVDTLEDLKKLSDMKVSLFSTSKEIVKSALITKERA